MSEFLDDEEVEQALVMETRQLRMLDGSAQPFTETRSFWETYDFVLQQKAASTRRLVRLALAEREVRDLPFEFTFPHVVGQHYIAAREKLEARIRVIDQALLAARTRFKRDFAQASSAT